MRSAMSWLSFYRVLLSLLAFSLSPLPFFILLLVQSQSPIPVLSPLCPLFTMVSFFLFCDCAIVCVQL
ncbi:MAG: hypothetical protein J3R72DRAFT_437723 [Linnemannia gamsii]|nr:MAG: hypothetical protein J3R72DRAFT_437723 [Linnemannia gamsii]